MSKAVIAFDFGTQSIGVAVGQTFAGTADELPTLKAKDGIPNWGHIERLLREWQPERLLVGLPFNMDGSESELAVRAKKFANRLHGRFGLPVTMVDERLSTFSAKQEARERGHRGNYAHKPVDSIAARLILESWLRENMAQGEN